MLNRRHVINGLGTLGGLMLTGCHPRSETPAATPKAEDPNKETYVLVHGAWHGGWCWQDVAHILESKGHRVFTPTLTGLAERAHLHSSKINLSTHVEDIINLIRNENLEAVTLVGHSYAGYVITLVADAIKDRLKHLIYLDASLPTEGQAFIPQAQHAGIIQAYGETYQVPPGTLEFLGIPVDHPKADWVKQQLTPHPLGTFFEPVKFENGGANGVSKTFIRCTGNPRHKSGDPVLKLIQNNPEWTYHLINTGHDAMITEPELLGAMLMAQTTT